MSTQQLEQRLDQESERHTTVLKTIRDQIKKNEIPKADAEVLLNAESREHADRMLAILGIRK